MLGVSLTGGRGFALSASNIPLSATSFNSTTQGKPVSANGNGFDESAYIGSVVKSQTMPSTLDVTVQMSCNGNFVKSVGTVAAFSLRQVP